MDRISQLTSSPAPRHLADLRPAADAAATRRIDRPTGQVVTPPQPAPPVASQVAAVSRSLLLPGTDLPTAPPPVERVLKPYGVQMLPASDRAPAPDPRTALPEGLRERPRTAPADTEMHPPGMAGSDEPIGLDPRALTEGQIEDRIDGPPR